MSVSFGDPSEDSSVRGDFKLDPDDDDDDTPASTVCLECLLENTGEQLARGLDLARAHGQVD